MTTAYDPAVVRAYLDYANRPQESDEQRATLAKRRQILGSLDDTYALNRAERGSADTLAVIGFNLVLVGAVASLMEPAVALWLVIGCLVWLAISVPLGVVGRGIGGRR